MALVHIDVLSSRQPGPHVLITAGVHGDEFEPIAAVLRLKSYFESDTTITHEFCGKLSLVPVVNEEAFRNGHRTGCDGQDLARVCPGRSDGSTTEQVARELSDLIESADFYIDLHTGGTAYSIFPMAGYMLHSDPVILDTQRRMARAFGLPVVWGTSASLEGRSLSVARDAGVPAIYAEYGGAATSDPRGVDAYVNGCLNVLGSVGCLSREVESAPVRQWVEDNRDGSGHLQIQNPSPIDGLFLPEVKTGDAVTISDRIGVVVDPRNGEQQAVVSRQEGIILVLRSFPHVRRGDSLCVILEKDAVSPPVDDDSLRTALDQ